MRRNKKKEKELALETVKKLFNQAASVKNLKLANSYVKEARKTAMKYRIRIPPDLKRKFCKHCYKYLVPGKNLRVRTRKHYVIYYCLECKKHMRFPYLRERKARRKAKA